MEAQVTCYVRGSTGNLDFVAQNSPNPKYAKFSNSSNVDVLLDVPTAAHKRDCSSATRFSHH